MNEKRFTMKSLSAMLVSALMLAAQCLLSQETLCLTRPAIGAAPAGEVCGASETPVDIANNVQFRVTVGPASTLDPGGWYKAFWIFGDGNFQYFPTAPNSPTAAAATMQNSYTYWERGVYKPSVYLTETYSNDDPPPVPRMSVNTPSQTTGTAENKLLTISGQNTGIICNHEPRLKYPTVFALSCARNSQPQRMLFLYNCLKTSSGYRAAPNLNAYQKTEMPNYFDVTSPSLTTTGETSAPSAGLTELAPVFSNFVMYDVSKTYGNIPQAFTELRTFPVLKTTDDLNLFPDRSLAAPMVVMVVTLGSQALTDSNPNYLNTVKILNNYFGDNVSLNEPLVGDFFVTGVQAMELHVKKSHDPNALNVLKITEWNPDLFKVDFSLNICNDGEIEENAITINFEDLSGGLFKWLGDIAVGPSASALLDSVPASHIWNAAVTNFKIPATPPNYAPSCREILFSMFTNAAGIERLRQTDPRVIRACVSFSMSTSGPECCDNNPIDGNKPIEKKEHDECDWLWMIFAGLALLGILGVLLGYSTKKSKNKL